MEQQKRQLEKHSLEEMMDQGIFSQKTAASILQHPMEFESVWVSNRYSILSWTTSQTLAEDPKEAGEWTGWNIQLIDTWYSEYIVSMPTQPAIVMVDLCCQHIAIPITIEKWKP
ncbi:hypothetical protein B7494_g4990 [Chlorociboria aeruginascens]|nr:hypothetical protein B7494_g4990 [Chlorociboria aeruginascens]